MAERPGSSVGGSAGAGGGALKGGATSCGDTRTWGHRGQGGDTHGQLSLGAVGVSLGGGIVTGDGGLGTLGTLSMEYLGQVVTRDREMWGQGFGDIGDRIFGTL